MFVDKCTISILKNFASINPNILIREGNVLKGGIPNVIQATAILPDITFPQRFALDNLSKFIHILEVFKEPHVEFFGNHLSVSDENHNHSFKLMYTEESIIEDLIVSDREIILPSKDIMFNMDESVLPQLMKALRILDVSEIHFHGDGVETFVSLMSSENPSSDSYSIKLGASGIKFRAVFSAEHLNLYPGDYVVSLCKEGIAKFNSEKVTYFIAIDNNNSYFQ